MAPIPNRSASLVFVAIAIANYDDALGALDRLAIRDFRFSDGSILPKGTQVTVPHLPMLFDEDVYGPTANEFDAFRFSKLKAQPGHENKHLFVQTTAQYMHFG